MQYVSCGKGHYYNPEAHASCPQCAREGGISMDNVGATEPVSGFQSASNLGVTEPVNGAQNSTGPMDTIGATEPVSNFQQQSQASFDGPLETSFFDEPYTGVHVDKIGATTFVDPFVTTSVGNSQSSRTRPVVGWLVCVEGAPRGRDFRIHSQYNYIGRARHMDICIEGDNSISAENAAILAYDDQQKIFFFAPGQGRNLVRVNGKAVLSPVELQAYDRLTVGKSVFLFIPLCGERFDWNDQQ